MAICRSQQQQRDTVPFVMVLHGILAMSFLPNTEHEPADHCIREPTGHSARKMDPAPIRRNTLLVLLQQPLRDTSTTYFARPRCIWRIERQQELQSYSLLCWYISWRSTGLRNYRQIVTNKQNKSGRHTED